MSLVLIKRLFISFSILSCSLNAIAATADAKSEKAGTQPNYDISGYARLASNYVDRGLSFSNGNFAFNGAFLINLGSQFKLGFWGSNISKLNAADDNLWIKYIGEVLVNFQTSTDYIFYIHDDRFYKSSSRNGQRFGLKINYGRFAGLIESQTNYEGTRRNGYYAQVKHDKKITSDFGVQLGLGYTLQSSDTYKDYADFIASTYYQLFKTGKVDLTLTTPSNSSQFGDRSKPAYFIGFQLDF